MGKQIKLKIVVSDEVAELRKEVRRHPKLQAEVDKAVEEGKKAHSSIFEGQQGDDNIAIIRDFNDWIGFLAAKENVLLHGVYTEEDMNGLCNTLRNKLIERRSVILLR